MGTPFKVRIHDKDRGMAGIVARLRAADENYLSVGIFGAKAAQPEPGRRGGPSTATVGEVAAWMEMWPAPGVPPRPFISLTFEKYRMRYAMLFQRLGSGIISGKKLKTEVEKLGEIIAGDVRRELANDTLGLPPNADSTVKSKGSDAPLVDTGTLMDAVDWRLTKTRPK